MPKANKNDDVGPNNADSLLADKKKSVEALLARVHTINDEFKFIYNNSRADITTELNDIITDISTLLPAFDEMSRAMLASSSVKQVFQVGELVGSCDNGFARIAEIVRAFDVSAAPAGASYTYLMTTQQDIDAFDQQHAKYESDSLVARVYADLVARIIESPVSEVEEAYMSHKHCDFLFAQYIIAALKKAPAQHIPYIEALERAKTRAIANANDYKQNTTLWPLQRFGLIPMQQGMTIAELTAYFFSTSKIAKESIDGFIELARAKKMNVAIIRAIVRNPIEHDIHALIAKTELKMYDANAGVNDAILERFNMTRKRSGGTSSVEYTVQEHVHAAGDRRWIVVRTIDDVLWDIMHLGSMHWMNAKTPAIAEVDVSIIERMRRGPSSRINAYNAIKNDIFAQHIYEPPPMTQDETTATDSVKKANKALINTIVARITGRILQYIDKALVPLPTNPKGIEDAISDPRFVEIMQEEFLASYSEIGLETADIPVDEMVGTFIADLEGSIAIQFARSIKLNMIELGPGAKIFKEYSGPALNTRIYNLFVDVIKRSVSSAILTKENVFEKILVKDHVLTALSRQLK